MHSYQGGDAAFYGPGLRLGTLAGVRINDRFSLNGEVMFNVSNVNGAQSGTGEYALNIALAPLLQIPAGPVEIVLGPKFGLFVVLDSNDRGAGIGTSTTQNGYVAGVNAGIFLPVSAATSMGVLLALELRRLYEICTTIPSAPSSARRPPVATSWACLV
jgi:hypothetical protein